MTTIANNTFAAACYDTNTAAELEAALRGPANEQDCAEWGITPEEWREAVEEALAAKREETAAAVTAKIAKIEEEWRAATAAIQASGLTGWGRQAAVAGIETGAMNRIGKAAEPLAEQLGLDPEEPVYESGGYEATGFEAIGRAAWEGYVADRLRTVIASI